MVHGSFPAPSHAAPMDRGFLVAAGDSAELTNWLTVTPIWLTGGSGHRFAGPSGAFYMRRETTAAFRQFFDALGGK